MLYLINQDSTINYLEFCIRAALELGELTPALDKQINEWIAKGRLSMRDRTMLNILQDAIQDGCIRRV
jgi:hypothetical protein